MLTLTYVNEVFQFPEIQSDIDASDLYTIVKQIQKEK